MSEMALSMRERASLSALARSPSHFCVAMSKAERAAEAVSAEFLRRRGSAQRARVTAVTLHHATLPSLRCARNDMRG